MPLKFHLKLFMSQVWVELLCDHQRGWLLTPMTSPQTLPWRQALPSQIHSKELPNPKPKRSLYRAQRGWLPSPMTSAPRVLIKTGFYLRAFLTSLNMQISRSRFKQRQEMGSWPRQIRPFRTLTDVWRFCVNFRAFWERYIFSYFFSCIRSHNRGRRP